MARTPSEIVEERQAKEQLQNMKETQSAQDAAATETVPGDQLAQPAKDLQQDPVLDDDPELLARIQDPHRANRPVVKTAVFRDAYGNKVRAAL